MGLIQRLKSVVRIMGCLWTRKLICFCALVSLSAPSFLYGGQYFNNFASFPNGATNFNDGSTLSSTALGTIAGVTNFTYAAVSGSSYSELQLTESGVTNVQSAFELPDLDPGTPIYAFSVKWNSDVYGAFPALGNGFSFNFGPLSSANLITNNSEEAGYAAGLCFSARTTSPYQPFELLVNGTIIATDNVYTAYQWGVNNPTRHFWEVDWNYYSGMSVRVDGQPIFTNVATTGFTPEAGDVFAWGTRCGTNSEEARLDNIVAVTGGNLVQLPAAGPYFPYNGLEGYDGYSVTNAFDGTNSTYYESEGEAGTVGATVSPPNPVLVYALTSGQSASSTPHEWTLEGSTNGGEAWTQCGAGSNYFLTAAETRAWLITNSVSFGAYELFFQASQGSFNAVTTIGELRLYALSVVEAPYLGWMQRRNMQDDPSQEWESIASSSNGTKLAAADQYEGIYLSTNSGDSWAVALGTQGQPWQSIASSGDGNDLAAVVPGAGIETNMNFDGSTVFSSSSALTESWRCIASSSDGVNLAAGVGPGGGIYVSANSGDTWTETAAPSEEWYSIACSSDGSKLAAGVNGGGIYVSSDFGNTWRLTSAPNGFWYSIASSSDGSNLVAAAPSVGNPPTLGAIYISTTAGDAWTLAPGTSGKQWRAVACSADGTKLGAAVYDGGIYFSTNSGNTWLDSGPTNAEWDSIACSSDGSRWAAVSFYGGLYTYGLATPPSPALHGKLSGNFPVLSWNTTNGGNFVLQECANLPSTNWSNVSLPVTINTNGSTYQVTDLPAAGQKFYRLVAQ